MKKVLAITLGLLFVSNFNSFSATPKLPANTTEIYSLKIYTDYTSIAVKQCGKLKENKAIVCIDKLIKKDPNPEVLRRTILVDSGSKVMSQTAKAIVRDAQALAAFEGNEVQSKDLQQALTEAELGNITGSFDKNKSSINLVLPLLERGNIVIVQQLIIRVDKGLVTIVGSDAFGRKFS
jgi:hypothetical protein